MTLIDANIDVTLMSMRIHRRIDNKWTCKAETRESTRDDVKYTLNEKDGTSLYCFGYTLVTGESDARASDEIDDDDDDSDDDGGGCGGGGDGDGDGDGLFSLDDSGTWQWYGAQVMMTTCASVTRIIVSNVRCATTMYCRVDKLKSFLFSCTVEPKSVTFTNEKKLIDM